MPKSRVQEKLSILDEIPVSELMKIANEAWDAAQGAQAKMGLNTKTGVVYKPHWKDLHLRKKQAVISEYLCGVMASFHYRVRFAEWANQNPGDAMRLFVALAPKSVEVDVEQKVGVLLVPSTSANLQEWMRETGVTAPEGQAHLTTSKLWDQIESQKMNDVEVASE